MKHSSLLRFFSVLCALLICALPVLAAEVDLSAMTDDEITALLNAVNQQIVDRGIEKTATVAKGAYIAGKDLPAGSYVYTCLAKGDEWGSVTVYSDGGSGDQLLWHVVSAPKDGEDPETIFVTLHDGDELKSAVAFSLTVYGGITFR